MTDLRDLADDEMLRELPPACFDDGTLVRDELARRLAVLRAELAAAQRAFYEVGDSHMRVADERRAAEAERDRLREAMEEIVRLYEYGPAGATPYAIALAALKEEKA